MSKNVSKSTYFALSRREVTSSFVLSTGIFSYYQYSVQSDSDVSCMYLLSDRQRVHIEYCWGNILKRQQSNERVQS